MRTSVFKIILFFQHLYNPSSLALVENDKIQHENLKKDARVGN